MLKLKRKRGDRVVLETSDGLVEITVDSTGRTTTCLAIDAPKSVRIIRGELIDRDAADAGR